MLTIRLQRGGRSGHAQYRVIVQDSRFSPTSGRIVAQVGTYNPHTKAVVLDAESIGTYLSNGAQPSDRVASLLSVNGIELPKWVKSQTKKESATRNVGKLRRNTPVAPEVASNEPSVEAEAPLEESISDAEPTPAEPATEEVLEPSDVVEATEADAKK